VNLARFIDNESIDDLEERIEANIEDINNTSTTQVVYIK